MSQQSWSVIALAGNRSWNTRRPAQMADFFELSTLVVHNFATPSVPETYCTSLERSEVPFKKVDVQEHDSTFKI